MFHSHRIRRSEPRLVFARNGIIGTITFLPDTREWLAEVNGRRRYCPNYTAALSFIESVEGLEAQPALATRRPIPSGA
jgi:hypothetical protein